MIKATRATAQWNIAKLAFFATITLASGLVFILTPDLLPSAMISALLFFIFVPLIDALERKGVSRVSAVLAVGIGCASLIALFMTWVSPRITKELEGLAEGKSRYTTGITDRLKAQEAKVLGDYAMFKNARLTEKALGWVQKSGDKLWEIVPNVASQLMICLLLVPFLTFILLKDGHEMRRQLLKLVPNRYFETVYTLLSRILDAIGGYVSARILEALIVTTLVTAGCLAAKVPYAILLGLFAGATNPIPYLGPLIGALPGVLLALLEPSMQNQLFWVSAIYIAANLIDMLVIFPVVVAKIVNLHPVVVVIAVILGSQLFGIVGMIVAVPITSILKILIQEIYSRVYNHEHSIAE